MVLRLSDFEPSTNAYKIRLIASLLGVPLELVTVDLLKGEHKKPEYLALNPRGSVPTIVDTVSGKAYTDSVAGLVLIAGTNPGPGSSGPSSFWSSDPVEQAEILDWVVFSGNQLPPVAKRRRYYRFVIAAGAPEANFEEELKELLENGNKALDMLEARLKGREWLAVGRPTIADVACFSVAAQTRQGKMSLSGYPAIVAWIGRVKNLPGFIPTSGLDSNPFNM